MPPDTNLNWYGLLSLLMHNFIYESFLISDLVNNNLQLQHTSHKQVLINAYNNKSAHITVECLGSV